MQAVGWPGGCSSVFTLRRPVKNGLSFWNALRSHRNTPLYWFKPRGASSWWRHHPKVLRRFWNWVPSTKPRSRKRLRNDPSRTRWRQRACFRRRETDVSLSGGSFGSAPIARSKRAASSVGFHTLDDTFCSHNRYSFANYIDGHDTAGAVDGGVPFSTPGFGNTDGTLKSNPDGTGIDDDVVPDDTGPEPGRSAGG